MPECTDPDLGALLHAYERNLLSEPDAQRFEVHLMKCKHCLHEVQSFKRATVLLAGDNDVKDVVRRFDPAQAQPESATKRLWRCLWPETPFIFRPVLAYLLVLIMAIPAYYGLRHAIDSDKETRRVQTIHLAPGRSSEDAVFKISSGRDGVISFVYPDAVAGKPYRVVVTSADGSEIARYDNYDGFNEFGVGELFLPVCLMTPGKHRLILIDPSGEDPSQAREYRFLIEE